MANYSSIYRTSTYPSQPTHADDGSPNTGAQILIDLWDGTMPRTQPSTTFTFAKARQMVLDSTLAMGIEYAVAPIIAAPYGVEAEQEEHGTYIEEQLLKPGHLTHFLYTSLYNEIMYGWAAFEVVFQADGSLDCLKALLNDYTYARRDIATGDFVGLKSTDRFTGMWVYLDAIHSLFVSHDRAGLGGYGIARLANVETAYDAWLIAADTAERYDQKMAGGMLKIDYLPRTTKDEDGNEVNNFDLAIQAARDSKGSGAMIVPNEPQMMGDKSVKTFEVERIDASGGQVDMISRMKYLDSLKLRGLIIPERAVTEASLSGSRADSVAHADVALLCMQLKAQQLLDCLNHYLVDRLIMIRFGPDAVGQTKLVAVPLNDEEVAFRQKIVLAAVADTATGPDVINMIDLEAELDKLGISRREEIAQPDLAEVAAQKAELAAKAAPPAPGQEQAPPKEQK